MLHTKYSLKQLNDMLKKSGDTVIARPYQNVTKTDDLKPQFKEDCVITVNHIIRTIDCILNNNDLSNEIYKIFSIEEHLFTDEDLSSILKLNNKIIKICVPYEIREAFRHSGSLPITIVTNYVAITQSNKMDKNK